MSAQSQTALLAHIAAQTKANIDFLVSQNYISAADARDVLNKLSSMGPGNRGPLSTMNMPGSNLDRPSLSRYSSSASDRSSIIRSPSPMRPVQMLSSYTGMHSAASPAAPPKQYAKAIWDYRESPDDLSFSRGDIIEIVEETNPDWWMGSLNGRRALFPSNYVEKMPSYSAAPQSPAPNPVPPPGPSYSFPSPSMPSMPSYGANSSPYNQNIASSPLNPSASPSPYIPRPSSRRGHSPTPSYSNSNNMYPNAGPGPGPGTGYSSPYQSSLMADQGGVKHAGYFTQQQQSSEPPPLPDASKKKNKFNDLGKRVATGAAGGVGFGVGSSIINSIF